jgi:hypothetical protein
MVISFLTVTIRPYLPPYCGFYSRRRSKWGQSLRARERTVQSPFGPSYAGTTMAKVEHSGAVQRPRVNWMPMIWDRGWANVLFRPVRPGRTAVRIPLPTPTVVAALADDICLGPFPNPVLNHRALRNRGGTGRVPLSRALLPLCCKCTGSSFSRRSSSPPPRSAGRQVREGCRLRDLLTLAICIPRFDLRVRRALWTLWLSQSLALLVG